MDKNIYNFTHFVINFVKVRFVSKKKKKFQETFDFKFSIICEKLFLSLSKFQFLPQNNFFNGKPRLCQPQKNAISFLSNAFCGPFGYLPVPDPRLCLYSKLQYQSYITK